MCSVILAAMLLICFAMNASAATSMSKLIKGYADTNSNFKVYTDRSTSSTKVGTAYGASDELKITKLYSDGWAKIEYPTSNGGTKSGYCKTDYLLCKTTFSDSKVTATEDIKAYKKDDCKSKYGTVYEGDKCYIIGDNGKNTQILYPVSGGYKSAWIKGVYTNHNGYLQQKDSSSGSSSSSKANAAKTVSVSLNVKKMRQDNKEWKDTYIGTKTIGQIGCTTTCMAMLYSYKKGSTYTPDKMVKKLSYSNNDLIWASVESLGYKVKSCPSNEQTMLETIYNALKQDKPVMFGAKKSGKQHWVVVNGYKGSTSKFKASDFTIIDPNSSSRKTLQDFLDYRPDAYKMVY